MSQPAADPPAAPIPLPRPPPHSLNALPPLPSPWGHIFIFDIFCLVPFEALPTSKQATGHIFTFDIPSAHLTNRRGQALAPEPPHYRPPPAVHRLHRLDHAHPGGSFPGKLAAPNSPRTSLLAGSLNLGDESLTAEHGSRKQSPPTRTPPNRHPHEMSIMKM